MCGAGFKQESDSSIWGEVGKKDFIPGTFVLGPVLMFQLIDQIWEVLLSFLD